MDRRVLGYHVSVSFFFLLLDTELTNDDRYLEARSSIPVDWNPSFVLHPEPHANHYQKYQRLARLIYHSVGIHLDLLSGTFPPDFEGTVPLHMQQHKKLFGTARIAKYGRDEIPTFHSSRHIVVFAAGHVYRLQVLEQDGTRVSQAKLAENLARIQENANAAAVGPNLSYLTALERDDWAGLRPLLPAAWLQTIDEALFSVSLETSGRTLSVADAAKWMLVGQEGNRWFDKWQLISCDDLFGFNLEHSPMDGHTFVSMFNNLWERLEKDRSPLGQASADSVVRLDAGSLDKRVLDGVARAKTILSNNDRTLSLGVLQTAPFGTENIKRDIKCSPDAFMQLSFQLAWLRFAGRIGSTYESGQIKRFVSGRTETIRPVTHESKRFVESFDSLAKSDPVELRKRFDAAAAKHVQRVNVAKNGKGWDRHLFALKNLARHRQQRLPNDVAPLPALFRDPSWGTYFNIEVSTSNSGALPFKVFSFGPVIPTGVGLGYQTFPNGLDVCATLHNRSADQFTQVLNKTMTDMRTALGTKQ